MAINFPDSPSNGDTTILGGKTYTYDSTSTSWAPAVGDTSATTIYSDMAALIAATGMSAGDQALVTALNKVFMYTGSAWYLVATMTNASPTAITGVDGSYALELDGTATTITAVSTDPEGFALTWSYAVTTGSLGSTATVSQADNVFTITPSSTPADAGSFSITFSVTDGATGAVNAVSAFTLSFSVTNSRHTAMLAQATATGSNQTFDDASASNHTITVAGDTTTSTISPHRHGGYSTYFDGTGDYLNLNGDAEFAFGTNDFTVEFWVYLTALNGSLTMFCDFRGSSGNGLYTALFLNTDSTLTYWHQGGSRITSTATIPLNAWSHIALTRSGNDVKLFINGQQEGSTFTNSLSQLVGTNGPSFGNDNSGSFALIGYMSDIRILNGTAAYTSNFTPPTEPLTVITNTKFLLGRLPYLKDQSASNHAITVNGDPSLKPFSLFDNAAYSEASHGASAYFDGIGPDKLDLSANSDFLLDGEFTIDFWFNADTLAPDYYERNLFKIGNGSGSGTSTFIYLTQSGSTETGKVCFTHSTAQTDATNGVQSGATAISSKTWNHVAITRDSGNALKMWLNGDLVETKTNRTVNYGSSSIGPSFGYNTTDGKYKGYISDFRIIKGTCLYTVNFTPPTAPLTAITNTKFLLNPETSISDLSQIGDIKLFGNAATSTTQVKFAGTKSIHFANSGDYLQITNSESWISGYAGNYTIEFWWYPTNIALGTYQEFLTCGTGFQLYTQSNGQVALAIDEANAGSFFWHPQNIYQLVDNTWTHFAIVKNGTAYTIYIDGVSKATTTSSNTIGTSTAILELGSYLGGQYHSPGYYQDFRITKGLARYTANFTPPTAELQG